MSALDTNGYQAVMDVVRKWPPDKRFALVRDVINSLEPEVGHPQAKRDTLKEALGLLATDQPAPSDDQVQEWLDERRMEKYG